MRLIKYMMVLGVAGVLAGCATYDERDASGRTSDEPGTYRGSGVDGLDRGVNTNWFGPVGPGVGGVGTPSGTYDHGR